MPLNYKKWDALEVSDDSDIEGHPNVDHKSLVRWKQRDIHEKRQARNAHIASLRVEIAANGVLLERLRAFSAALASAPDAPAAFANEVERLTRQPSPDGPDLPEDAPPPPKDAPRLTYDGMLLAVLRKSADDARAAKEEKAGADLAELLREEVAGHVRKLDEQIGKWEAELGAEESEKAKKLTSEDIHDGWDSKYVPAKPEPPPLTGAADTKKGKTKTKTTEFETLNPKASSSSAAPRASSSASSVPDEDGDDDDDELPEITPDLERFSRLPAGAYDQSYAFIQAHRGVVVAGAWDALLVHAFRAQTRGEAAYARQCVHQSLLLQYCSKLGPDGVRLFFRRMASGDPRAMGVFVKDVEDTYTHLAERVKASQAEDAAAGAEGREQIQLVPETEGTSISFNVPDGPPPERLVLEGPGTEDMDVEQVRRALQMRWDVFDGFADEMKAALRTGELAEVNKVLGGMEVEQAEELVQALDMVGILNFAEGGIRDETGQAGEGEGEAGEETDPEVE